MAQPGLYLQAPTLVPPQPGLYLQAPNLVLPNPNMSLPVGPNSCRMTCPSCHAQISTRTQHSSTTKTHLIALILCCLGCWPCVCIPYCCDECKATNHYCPNCNAFLGTYDR